jgi:predicted Rossmann-fold nucleotide-binding protein
MNAVCVFCASSIGGRPIYKETAERVGGFLAENKIALLLAVGVSRAAAPAAAGR